MTRGLAGLGAFVASATACATIAVAMLGVAHPVPETAPHAALGAPPPVHPQPAYPLEADYCYVEAMIPHHDQALELSGLVLRSGGVSERTTALAEFIVADQSAEIEQMRAWWSAWMRALPPADDEAAPGHAPHAGHADAAVARGCPHGGHAGMAGMATPAQLAELAAREGADAERLFLELMITHHEGALEMARTAVLEGGNAFVRRSAKHVLVEQEREVVAMHGLRGELP